MSGNTERLNAALAGRYKIEKQLGQGGMATVYLAKDIKHDRMVAVKVLKPELAAVLGAERFVVEIKTTAALQHPHILPLFDSGTADGFLYYVMPYIEGETLRGKLDRETQFSVDEAVRITTQVADALDYAHRHGVIHRDIKPENILLHDGRPMVADFGIALAVSAAAGGRMTETGLSLGTPHYMSPEQATAEKEITGRSDIYSLASVMFEMLTGNPPHTGASAQQIIMKIITEHAAPVTNLRKAVPPNVAAALEKALEKLPADRFESAKAFAEALMNRAFTSATYAGTSVSGLRSPVFGLPFVVAATIAIIATAFAARSFFRSSPPEPVSRFDLTLGAATPLPSSDVVISPDGTTLAYTGVLGSGAPAVYVRHIDGAPDFHKLAGSDGANAVPTFSPDSKFLAFRRNNDGEIVSTPVAGGSSRVIAELGTEIGSFLHWGTDDMIVYAGGPRGLFHVAAAGGTPKYLAKTTGSERYSFLLPNGSGILFSTMAGVQLYDFKTDSVTLLIPGAVHPSYVATGHIFYVAEGGLFAIRFDMGRHRITGPAARVLDRVAATTGQKGYSVSTTGVLVYRDGETNFTGMARVMNRLAIMDFTGKTQVLPLATAARVEPRFSPDGSVVAYSVFTERGAAERDIYLFESATRTNTRLTFSGDNFNPLWSKDGNRVMFLRLREGAGRDLFAKVVDNSAPEQLVLAGRSVNRTSEWLSDGTILYSARAPSQFFAIYSYSPGAGDPKPFLQGPYHVNEVAISPDGKLAAYGSTESGENGDIWLTDYPGAKGKWQVSTANGQSARWSPDNRYLYYWKVQSVTGDSLFRVRVDRSPAVAVRAPEFVLATTVARSPRNWDLHPDGKQFVVALPDVTQSSNVSSSRYLIALNWFTEMKSRMAVAK
jgi:serine/threonine protein kinase